MADAHLWAALFGGLVILGLAGDFLVTGALAIAQKFGVSPLTAGILIVGFGTSAPELFVSFAAALSGSPAIALGNLVGSNIANIWLVLAIPAVLLTVGTKFYGLRSAFAALSLVTFGFIGLTLFIPLNPGMGTVFLLALLIYFGWLLRQSHGAIVKGLDDAPDLPPYKVVDINTALFRLLVGIIGLPLGAYLVVEGGVGIARAFAVSEYVIGLSLLAIGTSLPELAAALAAATRRQTGLLIGNIIGSNIFNLLGAGGVIALFGSVAVPRAFLAFDYWVLGLSTLTLALFILPRERISRLAALALILLYLIYLYGLVSGWNLTAGIFGTPL